MSESLKFTNSRPLTLIYSTTHYSTVQHTTAHLQITIHYNRALYSLHLKRLCFLSQFGEMQQSCRGVLIGWELQATSAAIGGCCRQGTPQPLHAAEGWLLALRGYRLGLMLGFILRVPTFLPSIYLTTLLLLFLCLLLLLASPLLFTCARYPVESPFYEQLVLT